MTDAEGDTYDTTDDVSAQVAAEDEYLDSDFQAEVEINPGSHCSDVVIFDHRKPVRPRTMRIVPGLTSRAGDTCLLKPNRAGEQAARPAHPVCRGRA
jgi:hypothetical protein